MKNERPIVLNGADEWLLMSIRAAGGPKGATLTRIIAAGDMINHAVFNPSELRAGFAKLLAARYVREKDGKWFLREEGRDPKVKGNASSWPDPNVQDPEWNYPLSDRELEAAYREYREESAEALKKMFPEKKRTR